MPGIHHGEVWVDDLDAVTREWGGYTAYIADPEGYRWEIAHNPTPMGESLLP